MNSPSPRFYAEIFNRTNAPGQFLTIDSSVMNITDRRAIRPAARVGARTTMARNVSASICPFRVIRRPRSRIIRIPMSSGSFAGNFRPWCRATGRRTHLHGTNNPVTVADWKAALDVDRAQARHVQLHLSSARLDSARAVGRVHRLRGRALRQQGEVPELPRSAGAAGHRICWPASHCAPPTARTTACACSI